MLLATEWASRVGINPSLMETIGDEGIKRIALLTIWRNLGLKDRTDWWWTTNARIHGKLQTTGTALAFWTELQNKKYGLFGDGTNNAADPIQAYRHPWCLTDDEFATASKDIRAGRPPTAMSEDRVRAGKIIGVASIGVGTVTSTAILLGIAVTALAPAAALIGIAASLTAAGETAYDALENARFTQQLPALRPVYDREQEYRDRIFTAPITG